jgi:hypothetical protein
MMWRFGTPPDKVRVKASVRLGKVDKSAALDWMDSALAGRTSVPPPAL